MKDIRQSENWAKYLSGLGWEFQNINGTLIYLKRIGPSSVTKVQRPQSLSEGKLKKIEDSAIKNKTLFIKIEPLDSKGEKNLKKAGFERSFFPLLTPSSIFIDLTKSKEDLWKNLKKDAKYSIRKAQKINLKTDFYVNPNLQTCEKFFKILFETGKQKKFYVQPFSDLKTKINSFKDLSIVTLTKKDTEILSGSLILAFEGNAFYTHAASSNEGRKFGSSYFELWSTILHLKKKGIKTFDLEGIADERFPSFTKNWMGFSFFKKKFGGEIIKFPPPYIKYYNKILTTLRKLMRAPLPL
ncbi:hypothetical protein A2716_05155 [candidate division WWE3 bacterium RIFCSPHIGHO2_01_FULL_40_23]|uniref:BioF2-like acetyltransferase domain-containing protein n=1 Tax=candidate division WWE3 bacterium RIFCSPLOWO2_01_FULL_41_18 TaxID=1802625 RepID=A0A1F4VE58_UNCKA|nr:MAG: hypothetical protein A2716_05155 [candidate division WWE3 bacterium RIFCSPHIGHO2_01_FULL_40_23]OGC55258.1 MAG: hypothetical protein A3A78_04765 [candidate division WWE3 bacterium RIFCSPLOWO2_01_FULL_41_18]